MTYRILSAIRAWATEETKTASKNYNAEYRAALCNLCDAIRTIQKFH